MGMPEDRAALAAAANTIDGVNVTAGYRQITVAGQGVVRWAGQNRAENWFGFMNTWQIILALPQSIAATETWVDTRLEDLVNALSQAMTVTTINPYEITMDDGSALPAVIVEGALDA